MSLLALKSKNELDEIENVIMTRQEFRSFPRIPINRDVDRRLKKVAKLLRKPISTHKEVSLVTFSERGEQFTYKINGNTRDEIWENHQGTLIEPHLVPAELYVTIYHVANRKEAEKLYHGIDSSASAETGAEKITGIFGKLQCYFYTDKIKKGLLSKVLEFASAGTVSNPKGSPLSDYNREKIIKYFLDDLKSLDSIGIGKSNPRFSKLAMWTLALMALNKYSSNEVQTTKAIDGITKIKNNILNTSEWDGITHILHEWNSGPDNGELRGSQGSTCSTQLPKQLDFLLFHFKNYMDEVYESQGVWSRRTQRKNSKCGGNYFYKNWYTL
jgi:hypothetical protein